MFHWTSKSDIARDLSLAQGIVPADINRTVAAGDRPPIPNTVEETEEEYLSLYCGNGDMAEGPDLGLIKGMLDMVRESDKEDESEISPNTTSVMSELNPLSHECISNSIVGTPKISRNAAMESILNNLKSNHQETQKLLEPDHFLMGQKSILLYGPTFKRKTTPVKSPDCGNKSKRNIIVDKEFKPSDNADMYYKKLVEKNMKEDLGPVTVWTQAQLQMKLLEEKKRIEAERHYN